MAETKKTVKKATKKAPVKKAAKKEAPASMGAELFTTMSTTGHTVEAMPAGSGCVVKVGESICFVPNVRIVEGANNGYNLTNM